MKMWIVGEYLPRWSESGWALVGVFESEALAKSACPDTQGLFIAPVELNKVHAGRENKEGILMDHLYPEGDSWPGIYDHEVKP